MMKCTENNIRFLLYLVLTGVIFYFVSTYCRYDYAYAEQLRLFRYSDDYALPLLTTKGGLSTYLADYLTQFYFIPTAAACINTCFFLCVVCLMDVICSKLLPIWLSPLFSIFCGIYVLVQETNLNHRMEDTLTFILILAFLAILLHVRNKLLAISICIASIAILYYFSGGILPMATSGCTALLYHPLVQKWQGSKLKINKSSTRYALTLVTGIIGLWIGFQFFMKEHHAQSTRLKCLETMRWNKDWDGILSLPYMKVCPAPLYAAYQNLALAQKGLLGEKLNQYPQQGSLGLWYENHGLQNELMLLSDIYYIQGNVAMSQMMAFNGLAYATHHSHPRLMIRLIETNLILGAYEVAEKYIRILEETKYYKKTATSFRKFLHHPELIQQDEILGTLRTIAKTQNGFSSDMQNDLKKICEANPDYKPAKDYLDSYTILSSNEKAQ